MSLPRSPGRSGAVRRTETRETRSSPYRRNNPNSLDREGFRRPPSRRPNLRDRHRPGRHQCPVLSPGRLRRRTRWLPLRPNFPCPARNCTRARRREYIMTQRHGRSSGGPAPGSAFAGTLGSTAVPEVLSLPRRPCHHNTRHAWNDASLPRPAAMGKAWQRRRTECSKSSCSVGSRAGGLRSRGHTTRRHLHPEGGPTIFVPERANE